MELAGNQPPALTESVVEEAAVANSSGEGSANAVPPLTEEDPPNVSTENNDEKPTDGSAENKVDRSGWAEASQAALQRLQKSEELFNEYLQNPSIDKYTWHNVVLPNVHLTDYTWKRFRNYVQEKGFKARRRAASEEEKHHFKETRKGKVYFIDCRIPPVKKPKKITSPKEVPILTSTTTTLAVDTPFVTHSMNHEEDPFNLIPVDNKRLKHDEDSSFQ